MYHPTDLMIYGAGGAGREIVWMLEQFPAESRYNICCFIDDSPEKQHTMVNDIQVFPLEEALAKFPQASAVVGVGSPKCRKILAEKLTAKGVSFATLMHPTVYWSAYNQCGEGSILQKYSAPTVNITIGRHVLINGMLTIGHDSVIGDYATIGPGTRISGNTTIEEGAYIGAGAVIIGGSKANPIVIGKWAVVGAAACVRKSVLPGQVVVGVPAQPKEERHKS